MLIAVVLIVVALGGGFFAGIQYQKSQRANLAGGTFQNGQMMRRFGTTQNVRPVRGQVISMDNNSMTIKLQNGNSDIVILAPSTLFVKSATAAATDMKNGDTVMIIGTQNSDGSVTASDVQINPPSIQRGQAPQGQ